MWVILAVLSALCLGFYDICKKRSLNSNSVVGVLAVSICISSLLLSPLLFYSRFFPDSAMGTWAYVPVVNAETHGWIFLKSCLVLSSWICAYSAMKHLPISVVSTMQTTRPMWTLLGAIFLFGEVLNGYQWAGIACALGSIFLFSFTQRHTVDRKEIRPVYYVFLALAILLGASSGLYDKYLMRRIDHNAVQVYYTYYQALLMLTVWGLTRLKQRKEGTAKRLCWRWEIVGISAFLVLSDFVYLLALSDVDSLLAIVSTIRRSGTIIPFAYGIFILREKDAKKKGICLLGILLGLIFLLFGSL